VNDSKVQDTAKKPSFSEVLLAPPHALTCESKIVEDTSIAAGETHVQLQMPLLPKLAMHCPDCSATTNFSAAWAGDAEREAKRKTTAYARTAVQMGPASISDSLPRIDTQVSLPSKPSASPTHVPR
jgi:hypothetical protein